MILQLTSNVSLYSQFVQNVNKFFETLNHSYDSFDLHSFLSAKTTEGTFQELVQEEEEEDHVDEQEEEENERVEQQNEQLMKKEEEEEEGGFMQHKDLLIVPLGTKESKSLHLEPVIVKGKRNHEKDEFC